MPLALISVFHKEGIDSFARQLYELGWEIISSGGTAEYLTKNGIPVRDVASLAGGEAILGHRVVTLSREVHAGLLAKDTHEDQEVLDQLGIPRIDLVCVDLYPLEEEINTPGSSYESVIERTDIGGPTMLRSGAKGGRIVVVDPADRQKVVEWLKEGRPDDFEFRQNLAAKTEKVIAEYCLTSSQYHSKGRYDGLIGEQVLSCKYGENGWQTPAALYSTPSDDPLSLDKFTVRAGTAPSYNNLCDVDRLLQTITHIAAAFDLNFSTVPYIAVGAKHGNSCGAAFGTNKIDVLEKMISGDTRAIFGGLVITNFQIEEEEAETLLGYKMPQGQRRLLDGVIAPDFSSQAISQLERKGDKCRFLANCALGKLDKNSLDIAPRFRYVRGGFLKQPNYSFLLNLNDQKLENIHTLSDIQKKNMLLAWAIGSTSNSNTVTLTKDCKLLGNGVGQQDRVGGCTLAIHRAVEAGHDTAEAIAYSDSFFPFTDGPEVLANAKIAAIMASSGSIRDIDIKTFCESRGIPLILIPDAEGRGFFGH